MKRKIFKFIGLALFAGAIAFNLYVADQNHNKNQTSKVTLQNIASLTAAADEYEDQTDGYCEANDAPTDCWYEGVKYHGAIHREE